MPTQVTINSITGSQPYNVWICNSNLTSCLYVDTIATSSIPYIFNIPQLLDGLTEYKLKVVDNVGCTAYEILSL